MSKLPFAIVIALVALTAPICSRESSYWPAQLRSGGPPAVPVNAVGGGEVWMELAVSDLGRVTGATPLRTTPPYTEFVLDAVRSWQFAAAVEPRTRIRKGREEATRVPVESRVLFIAIFRAPALTGPVIGEPPKDVAVPSTAAPMPITTPTPSYPPMAFGGGVVFLEVGVDAAGAVSTVKVLGAAPPFDDAAVETVKGWRFRPAQVNGAPTATLVYVAVAFRPPV
jgi:TonB family protein